MKLQRNLPVTLAWNDFCRLPSFGLFYSSFFSLRDGGGLTTMLFFHCLSSFLDNLLLIPCSISRSLFTVNIRAIWSKDKSISKQIILNKWLIGKKKHRKCKISINLIDVFVNASSIDQARLEEQRYGLICSELFVLGVGT